jgi:hypothetical protein
VAYAHSRHGSRGLLSSSLQLLKCPVVPDTWEILSKVHENSHMKQHYIIFNLTVFIANFFAKVSIIHTGFCTGFFKYILEIIPDQYIGSIFIVFLNICIVVHVRGLLFLHHFARYW